MADNRPQNMKIDNPPFPHLAAGPGGPLARREKGGWGIINAIWKK